MKKLLDNYLSLVRNYFPDKKINKPSVGLDIGAYSCKAVEIVPTEDTFTISNIVVEPVIRNNVADAVRNILGRLENPPKSIATSISGQGTLIRYIDMPKMQLEDARKSFNLEADKYFPFAKEQIYTDCFIVDTNLKENKMSLLVAAAKKEIVEHRMQLLSGLGLQTNYIGINSIAIANVFNTLKKPAETKEESAAGEPGKTNAFAVLDIGEVISSLVIIKGNVPRFTRDIFIGGREFNQRISNVLGVEIGEAEKIKRQPADKLESIRSACDAILLNLASEVRLSFDYFVTENNTQISKLFLTGGSSLLIGVEEFFEKNLDTPIEKWNPVSSLKLSPVISESDLKKNQSYLGVALGLALYQYD